MKQSILFSLPAHQIPYRPSVGGPSQELPTFLRDSHLCLWRNRSGTCKNNKERGHIMHTQEIGWHAIVAVVSRSSRWRTRCTGHRVSPWSFTWEWASSPSSTSAWAPSAIYALAPTLAAASPSTCPTAGKMTWQVSTFTLVWVSFTCDWKKTTVVFLRRLGNFCVQRLNIHYSQKVRAIWLSDEPKICDNLTQVQLLNVWVLLFTTCHSLTRPKT